MKPKARAVPFTLRTAIEDELDYSEREGIIQKVSHSEWATPIIAMPKHDSRICLCGDFKVTVNQALSVDQYPLPEVDDLLATLAGGKRFTKLDLLIYRWNYTPTRRSTVQSTPIEVYTGSSSYLSA